jgi:hypothetical protein
VSDTPPENLTGWWLADDGKYYAPELHPDYVAPTSRVAPNRPQDSDTQSLYSEGNIASGWSLAATGEWVPVELSQSARSLGIRPVEGTAVRWVDLADVSGVHEVEPASEAGVVGVELAAIGHDTLTIRMQQSTLDSLLSKLQSPTESAAKAEGLAVQREEAAPLPLGIPTSPPSLAASSPLFIQTADLPNGSALPLTPPLPGTAASPIYPPAVATQQPLGSGFASDASVSPVTVDAWTSRIRILVFGGAAGLVLGSLLPWVQISGFITLSVAGTEGDGVFTLIAGIVVALLFAVIRPRMAVAVTVLVGGALATLFAIYELINVTGSITDPEVAGNEMFSAQIGSGLWIVGIAALVLLAGGIDAVARVRNASAAR